MGFLVYMFGFLVFILVVVGLFCQYHRLLQSQCCCFIREIQFRLTQRTVHTVDLPCETAVLALLW